MAAPATWRRAARAGSRCASDARTAIAITSAGSMDSPHWTEQRSAGWHVCVRQGYYSMSTTDCDPRYGGSCRSAGRRLAHLALFLLLPIVPDRAVVSRQGVRTMFGYSVGGILTVPPPHADYR